MRPQDRRATTGYSMAIPGICSRNKYAIMEFHGFNESKKNKHLN